MCWFFLLLFFFSSCLCHTQMGIYVTGMNCGAVSSPLSHQCKRRLNLVLKACSQSRLQTCFVSVLSHALYTATTWKSLNFLVFELFGAFTVCGIASSFMWGSKMDWEERRYPYSSCLLCELKSTACDFLWEKALSVLPRQGRSGMRTERENHLKAMICWIFGFDCFLCLPLVRYVRGTLWTFYLWRSS